MTIVYDDHEGQITDVPVRRIRFTVNGEKKIAEVEPRLLLAHLIRRGLGLTALVSAGGAVYAVACFVTGAYRLSDIKALLGRRRPAKATGQE